MLRFLRWYEGQTQVSNELGEAACKKVSISLHLDQATTNQQLLDGLDLALTYFEAYINNVADGHGPMLSMQGAPIDALLESVLQLSQFRRKPFFFLIDEYENLLDYQQRVLNTLIKHSGDLYTFKIGVKELGWRVRSTLNEHEQLISPADYARIDIGEQLQGSRFNAFALRVCDERLTRISDGLRRSLGIRNLFAGMTEDEEAELLGVRQAAAQTEKQLRREGLGDAEMLEQLRPLQVCLIDYWARHTGQPVAKQFADFIDHRPEWERRYNNYKHVLLYTLHRGRPGIRKYYAGWATLTKVAASNIRYLLQLVYESILEQLLDGETLAVPIPPEKQTRAAQKVGRSNLTELEGLTVHGARLTKLVLGLGRVFGLMAAYPEGHAPEVNQFHLAADKVDDETEREVKELLDAAVQHLALLRSPGTKLADQGDTREYDYFVHPIFAPFFVFSYRRKRKMRLSAADVLGLVSSPKRTIPAVLSRSGRQAGEPLPEQLSLFESYYASDL